MQAPRKRAFEKILSRVAARQALAQLTAEVEQGRLVLGEDSIELGETTSVKVSLKPHGDAWLLSVRLKDAPSDDAAGGESVRPSPDAPRYKDLKKRMQRTFKILCAEVAAGRIPEAQALAAFTADSRRMTTYPGKGDAFYPAYEAAVGDLEAAAASGDLAALTQSVAALRRLKKECHSRHA